MKSVALIVAVGLLALGACKRGAQTKEAVQSAVMDYLAKRGNLNMASMQIDVVSVTFRENEADATVTFRAKGADASAGPGMTMAYTLVRQGGGWAVKPRADGAAPSHASGGSPPEGAPAGHPPIEAPPPAETKK